MADRLTRLRDLVIKRVAFVGAGDNPEARVVIWKERPEGGPTMGADVTKNALEALRARSEGAQRTADAASARATRLLGGPSVETTKADTAAERLHGLVEKYIDRHPTTRDGRDMTPEMALDRVSSTPEGRRAIAAVREAGREGQEAFEKISGGDVVEKPEPIATRGEERLDSMAETVAKAKQISKEQALIEVIETDAGRAAYAEHRQEVAARSA